jgi:tetratricopeptide (TPR) repeat protein
MDNLIHLHRFAIRHSRGYFGSCFPASKPNRERRRMIAHSMPGDGPKPETASPLETEVLRIQGLMEQRQLATALAAAEALAGDYPQNRDALYMMAVCQRYLGRVPDALATLVRLEKWHPKFSRLFQERGYCYAARREAEPAIQAFVRAVNLNHALAASWKALQTLFRMTNQAQCASNADSHVAKLAELPAQIVTATGMLEDGELLPAEKIVREYLLKHGNDVEAMRLLAKIGLELDVLDDAELLLESVLLLAPDYRAARYDYARVLLERHKHAPARAELDKLVQTEPDNRAYLMSYAAAYAGLGEHERAIVLYRKLLAETPQAEELHLSIGHAQKTLGRTCEAIESYRAARCRADFGDAYWSLANLKTYRFSDEEIECMRGEESVETTPLEDRQHFCFALGKALEDRGDYAGSFDYYQRGNALKKSVSRYRPETIERNARLQMQVCTRDFFAERAGVGCPSEAPIFIVGLPRAGSTLLEQILASHSRVEGTLELPDIPRLVAELVGRDGDNDDPRYPAILASMQPQELRRLGESYLADTRPYRAGKPHFIDKMPNNFRHIGLIQLILPNARIIDARREPMACCFSNFKQLFASGQEFTYSLEDIARYYRSYVALMNHWDAVLPGKVLRIQHEELVEDLTGHVQRLLEFCGLGFEPACLEFHKTDRSIRTASSEQVRQPISRAGLDQWRHFEPWLDPLKNELGILLHPNDLSMRDRSNVL